MFSNNQIFPLQTTDNKNQTLENWGQMKREVGGMIVAVFFLNEHYYSLNVPHCPTIKILKILM